MCRSDEVRVRVRGNAVCLLGALLFAGRGDLAGAQTLSPYARFQEMQTAQL
jgi:hypothetical protein